MRAGNNHDLTGQSGTPECYFGHISLAGQISYARTGQPASDATLQMALVESTTYTIYIHPPAGGATGMTFPKQAEILSQHSIEQWASPSIRPVVSLSSSEESLLL